MYLFPFRSRTQAMKFFDLLRQEALSCRIMNTPRIISVGCGLSVLVCEESCPSALKLFSCEHFDTFLGLFEFDGHAYRRCDFC